jgi:hypothetical protein
MEVRISRYSRQPSPSGQTLTVAFECLSEGGGINEPFHGVSTVSKHFGRTKRSEFPKGLDQSVVTSACLICNFLQELYIHRMS